MSEYITKSQDSQIVSLFDINGSTTVDLLNSVAKKVEKQTGNTYYVRVEGISPVYHETFRANQSVINPNLVRVDEECFDSYIDYLYSKKEGQYLICKNMMRNKGFV